jgi:hypothetical protein
MIRKRLLYSKLFVEESKSQLSLQKIYLYFDMNGEIHDFYREDQTACD